jgi:hypothetical protein
MLARPGEQHNDQAFVDLLAQMNRDDRMGQLYTYLLDQWYSKGGKTFTFAGDVARASKWGAWGLQETYSDTSAAKYKAVQQYLQRLKSSADFNKDGLIDQRDYNIWRWTDGATVPPYADANADGIVDGGDYVMWRKTVGTLHPAASSSASGFTLVPEPGAVALVFGAMYISLVDLRWLLPRN